MDNGCMACVRRREKHSISLRKRETQKVIASARLSQFNYVAARMTEATVGIILVRAVHVAGFQLTWERHCVRSPCLSLAV